MAVIQPVCGDIIDRVVRSLGLRIQQVRRQSDLHQKIGKTADMVCVLQTIEEIHLKAELTVAESGQRLAAFSLGRGGGILPVEGLLNLGLNRFKDHFALLRLADCIQEVCLPFRRRCAFLRFCDHLRRDQPVRVQDVGQLFLHIDHVLHRSNK